MWDRVKALANGVQLRHDGRRLGLEGVFSGAALGLVLLYLIQEQAAARGLGPGTGPPPAAADAGLGRGSAGSDGQPRPRRRLGPGLHQGDAPPLVTLPPLGDGGAAVPGREPGLPATDAPDTGLLLAPPLAQAAPLLGQPLWLPPWGGGGGLAAAAGRGAVPPPALLVVLRVDDTLVASTALGAARVQQRGRQVAIDGAWIDLRASPLPLVRVQSEHALTALARSPWGPAAVTLDQQHQGLFNSTLLLGAGDGRTELGVIARLDLAPLTAADAAVLLQHALATLQGSRVFDPGGDDLLQLTAQTHLGLPPGLDASLWQLQLGTWAMRDSALELAGGNNRIAIRSTLAIDGPPQPTWQLQTVALERSQLRSGSGDDTLLVDGAIVDSSLDLGAGRNSALLQGPVQDGTLQLSAGGHTTVQLGPQADALRLTAAGDAWSLVLRAGGGDDRLWLPELPPSASLDLWGEAGRDLWVLPSQVRGGGSLVLADLQWDGAQRLSDDLAWGDAAAPLIPSGLEGLGQARLLPIAPLEQLLAGLATAARLDPQLAIATGSSASQLLWLDPLNGQSTVVASLPALIAL